MGANLASLIDVSGAPPIPGLTFRRFRGAGLYHARHSFLFWLRADRQIRVL